MSEIKPIKLSEETNNKIIMLAVEILSMHGSVAGDRVCQDWSGSDEFNPLKLFTEKELQDISYNYEIENSNLDDYCPEYHFMHDEMVASFAISECLKKIHEDHTAAIKQAKIEAVREFVNKELPRIDSQGLDENEHCCELILHRERERIHKAAEQLKEQE